MPRIMYSDREELSDGSLVRILCGSRQAYVDRTGNEWLPDRFFVGGSAVASNASVKGCLPTSGDQKLYQTGRQGKDFSYSIPVKPGLYTVRLKLAETTYKWSFERPFNVSVNGRQMLRNFDICQAARGSQTAYERVFRNVAPDADGMIQLRFTGGFEPRQQTDNAMVQAIEVLPEIKPVVRVNAGSDELFIDWNSYVWDADSHFEGGNNIQSDTPVSQASPTLYDQHLYKTARSGRSFSYSLAVPPGVYCVHLKFAELWLSQIGQRPMNIEINGLLARENWDPGSAAGQLGMAADLRVNDMTPDCNGRINIRISATRAHDAVLQGIEIE